MRKFIAVISLLFLGSCALANPGTGPGVLYTNVTELVYYDSTVIPIETVEMCSHNYFGLVSVGNISLDTIKYKTSIRKISSIERSYHSSFLVTASSCLVVKGQN